MKKIIALLHILMIALIIITSTIINLEAQIPIASFEDRK